MTNIGILQANAAVYIATFLIYYYKKRAIDLGWVCLFIFSIASIGSVVYYSFPEIDRYYPNIRIEPLIYIYVLFIISVMPLLLLKIRAIKKFNIDFKYLKLFSHIFIIASIPVFLNLIIDVVFGNFGGNYFAMMYENDSDNSKFLLLPIVQPFYAVMRRFFDIIVVLFILNIIYGNKREANLLILSVSVFFLMPILSGSRGGLVISCIKVSGYYILLSSLLNTKIKNIFRILGLLVIGLALVGLTVISISRFSNMEGDRLIQQWISQYVGEGFIRFSDVVWDIKKTLDGDKNFPFLKSLLGLDVILDNKQAIDVYSAYLGIPTNVFYTFVGSFYLDFGRYWTVLWFISISIVSLLVVRKIMISHSLNFLQIFYIVYLFNFCAVGFTANPYAISHTQRDIFIQFILIGIIHIFTMKKQHSHIQ